MQIHYSGTCAKGTCHMCDTFREAMAKEVGIVRQDLLKPSEYLSAAEYMAQLESEDNEDLDSDDDDFFLVDIEDED